MWRARREPRATSRKGLRRRVPESVPGDRDDAHLTAVRHQMRLPRTRRVIAPLSHTNGRLALQGGRPKFFRVTRCTASTFGPSDQLVSTLIGTLVASRLELEGRIGNTEARLPTLQRFVSVSRNSLPARLRAARVAPRRSALGASTPSATSIGLARHVEDCVAYRIWPYEWNHVSAILNHNVTAAAGHPRQIRLQFVDPNFTIASYWLA
jgi:hypothetical protein